MIPGFLAHGGMVLVRKVILEADLLKLGLLSVGVTTCTTQWSSHSTIDHHVRVASLLKLHMGDMTGRTSSTCLQMIP